MSGKVTLIVALLVFGVLVVEGNAQQNFARPVFIQQSNVVPNQRGPGTEMTQIINRLGLGSDCWRCQALAAEMDRNGAAWVQQNRQYVVQRTISNAKGLGHPMGPIQRFGVRAIVQRSIRLSSR